MLKPFFLAAPLMLFASTSNADFKGVNAECFDMSILSIDIATNMVKKVPPLGTVWRFSYIASEDDILWFYPNTGEGFSELSKQPLKIIEKDTQHLVAINLFSRGYAIYTLSFASSSVHAYLYQQNTEDNPKGSGRQYFASCQINRT